MTQEEKDLLLRDLCARLPYWVICDIGMEKKHALLSIHISRITETLCEFHNIEDTYQVPIANVKPYLRPMLSMTEEEQKEFVKFHCVNICPIIIIEDLTISNEAEMFDWLNTHYFDYRGLIDKGLAIAVTEDNNPYNDIKD